ncbi:hypothetical protein KQI52_03675 [bacterium]|nr:hypothetical protein [bacterium]
MNKRYRPVITGLLVLLSSLSFGSGETPNRPAITVTSDGDYDIVEVGGSYVGAEFHRRKPAPTRISFYTPVANSLDPSQDYWTRDTTRTLELLLQYRDNDTGEAVGGMSVLNDVPWDCDWTPYRATFSQFITLKQSITYEFGQTLPLMAVTFSLENPDAEPVALTLGARLNTTLRTCHTYTERQPAQLVHWDTQHALQLDYPYADTDSASVLLLVDGLKEEEQPDWSASTHARAEFSADLVIPALGQREVTLLIASCRLREAYETFYRVRDGWREDVRAHEQNVMAYADRSTVYEPDRSLTHTERWAKAVMQVDRHWLNGSLVPMPCPAQYNFFFTHDMLLTNLGTVYFDTETVRADLRFLHSLTRADSTLAHAYYWKDGEYVTEFCGDNSWNHLWFIQLAAAYLRHSGDTETVSSLLPELEHSLAAALSQRGQDGLVHGNYPDWWDIGNVPGARAYLTSLTARALEDAAFIAAKLEHAELVPNEWQVVRDELLDSLNERLWSDEHGYLLNTIGDTLDTHLYAGSLVAAWFDQLPPDRAETMVATATRELVDPEIGLRIVMPADFHLLEDAYNFHGPEAGAAYTYINGGVWPHGNAWYAFAQLHAGDADGALASLQKFLTLDGVRNSPNGQASFYEYRFSDPESPKYGSFDKPTFLWMGGWYMNVLYSLAGVREDPWGVRITPERPSQWETHTFPLTVNGQTVEVTVHGDALPDAPLAFRRILRDGEPCGSAVLYGSPSTLEFERGVPEIPYLVSASVLVEDVSWSESRRQLTVQLRGTPGQIWSCQLVSQTRYDSMRVVGDDGHTTHEETVEDDGVIWTTMSGERTSGTVTLTIQY